MIELKNVSFSYAEQGYSGIRNVDLKVAPGECVLLCGRSGCGKTTVTRLVNGLIPHFYNGELEGSVLVNGKEIAKTPMYEIAESVGSVFQNPRTQFFNVDTDSEIAFGIENKALPLKDLKSGVEKTIKDLELQDLSNRNIFELSGGEKQQIAFASVYAMNPDIYLLDEPSSNLDMLAIERLKRQLHIIKRQGKTILIAEHRLYYLMDLVDRIVYLEEGSIKGIYTPNQFRSLPQKNRESMGLRALELSEINPVAKAFISSEPIMELKDIALYHRKRKILENINLTASPGEIIAVTGHNGTGKTTFSRALSGLHKDYKGIFLWGENSEGDRERGKRTYMVLQDVNYQLFAESVESECSFGIGNPDKELIIQTMKDLGIYQYGERHPNTLSGGQKQRVAVAVSMICRKDVLIFDEPTSGLDFHSMRQVSGMIRKLSELGKVIFVVTHDYEFICQTCSRLLHFDEGEMSEDLPINTDTIPKLRELFAANDKGEVNLYEQK